VYGLSVVYGWVLSVVAARTGSGFYAELGRQLPGQLSYFMSGAFLYYFLPQFERHVKYFIFPSVLILVINRYIPLVLFEPFALACVVVFFGLFLYVGNFGRYGDFSYGIYILHFPIIQLVMHFKVFQASPWAFLAVCVTLTMVGAVAMWNFVEKKFLMGSSHYISTISGNPESARLS
jgi:peptidoglycan/LPS O-acetylase OafA/YrhL